MGVSASYGIMACAVCLLMISGEVDLSVGVMTGSTGLLLGMLISEVGMELLAGPGRRAGVRRGHRVHERHARDLDEAAELHRHPGDDVRAHGLELRGHPGGHRPGPGGRDQQGRGVHAGAVGVRLAAGLGVARSRWRWAGGCWSWCSAPGCCSAPGRATGSTPSVATQNAARNTGVPVRRTKVSMFVVVSLVRGAGRHDQRGRAHAVSAGQGHRLRVLLHHRRGRGRDVDDRRRRLGDRREPRGDDPGR